MAVAANTVVSIDVPGGYYQCAWRCMAVAMAAHTVVSIDEYLIVRVGLHVAVFVDVITHVIRCAFVDVFRRCIRMCMAHVAHADLDRTLTISCIGSIQDLTGS